jgi:hypothetical protein
MFYPSDAPVPEILLTKEFLLRPLRATDVQLDYDAVINSRTELLRSSGGTWPREGFTLEEDVADLELHEREPEAASGWFTRQHIAALRLDLEICVGAALSTLLNPIARLAKIAFHLCALKEGKIERDLLVP